MPDYDWRETRRGLLALAELSPEPLQAYRDHTAQFIDVGEYDLALDNISGAYLEAGTPIPPEVFDTIERLAAALDTLSDPEYGAVAELLAAGRPRP